MVIWIGTSGWNYRDWLGAFYPRRLSQRDWLGHYAARFATVELNNSFYRLPSREQFSAWAAQVPAGFLVCPKVSRYLTHVRRLADPQEPADRFLGVAEGLGERLGPSLIQLPPTLRADTEKLDATLTAFGPTKVAVEFRHGSWFTAEARHVLERHGAALCLADRGSRWLTPVWRTADFGYLRFHAGRASPAPCYGRSALRSRAAALAEVFGHTDVFVYFNNDQRCCAVRDARVFARACERYGLPVTRVPDAGDVRLAD